MKRVAILLSVLLALAPSASLAQTTSTSAQETGKKRTSASGQGASATSDESKQVSLELGETDRIILRNRFGPIVVTGIGGDTLEATATKIRQGTGDYKFKVAAVRQGQDKIMITTAVITPGVYQGEKKENKGVGGAQGSGSASTGQVSAPRSGAQGSGAGSTPKATGPSQTPPPQKAPPAQPGTPAQRAEADAARRPPRQPRERPEITLEQEALRGVGDIRLEVKLPRNAHVDLIDSRRYAIGTSASGAPAYLTNTRNDVVVTNMETPISVVSSGDVKATKVGGLEARTRSSGVYVKDIDGPVNVTTVTGVIVIENADGDVRAVSISGTINVECARGRADVATTTGGITLLGIGGDLDVATAGGTISFTGAIRDGGRYRLKSMSGLVRMLIQKEPGGFVASLSSYKGQILLDFDLKTELSANTASPDLPSTQGQPVRRITGRYGNGDARITLDSFSGTVQLARSPSEVWKKCR
jgi:hypothetical protein